MGSPVLIPFRSFVQVDRKAPTPVYLQVAHRLIEAIQRGHLPDGQKLPGTRRLSDILGLHRNTVAASYAELQARGWISVHPSRGTFVRADRKHRPERPRNPGAGLPAGYPADTGFPFKRWNVLDSPFAPSAARLHVDDGLPDPRLSHVDYLARLLRTNMKRKGNRPKLGYSNLTGNEYYKDNLANFLHVTRGLPVSRDNILVTRSLELGIYVVAETLLSPGDRVVVGELSYFATNMILQKAGAIIETVPVDEEGLDVSAIRTLCIKRPFRMLYLTPHHHYPTTVTLSTQRRAELLALSLEYGFVIVEDDYDFDFHYDSHPQLPLASIDREGMVVYVGTFGRSLAPGFRSGFVVAPKTLIHEMEKLLGILDRHGDVLTELALAEFIADGEIHRYLRMATNEYRERRDHLAHLLVERLGGKAGFAVPAGGLAFWTTWPQDVNLMRLSRVCSRHELYLPRYLIYQSNKYTGIRFGFGSMTPKELTEAVDILSHALQCL